MAKKKAVARKSASAKTASGVSTKPSKTVSTTGHKAKASPASSPTPKPAGGGGVGGLLAGLNKKATASPKKKSEKHIIVLEDGAADLLALQEAKAEAKVLEGKIQQLESELIPALEEHRIALNVAKQTYIGSVHVQATGKDEDGDNIEAGQASYYVQARYSPFNPYSPATDDDLQETYDGEATVHHEAVNAIMESLANLGEKLFNEEDGDYDADAAFEAASQILKDRMEVENNISLVEGALATDAEGNPLHPQVIKVLQEHLADFLVSSTKMKPTQTFHEKSNYDAREMTIMMALNNIGLAKRSKAVLKASGAPKAKAKAVKRR